MPTAKGLFSSAPAIDSNRPTGKDAEMEPCIERSAVDGARWSERAVSRIEG